MAILLMDGFDGYVDSADFQTAQGAMISGSILPVLYQPTGGRYGGGAMDFNSTQNSWYARSFAPQATGQKIYAGFAYKGTISGSGTSFDTLFQFVTAGTPLRIMSFQINNQGTIRALENDSSSTDSAAGVIVNNTWHWIEAEVTLGSTNTNGAVEVRVDGATVISNAVNVDTFSSSTALCNGIRFFGHDQDGLVDDLVVWNDQGTAPTGFIGDSRISTYLPTADGAVMDWTPSAGSAYACIDDPLGSPDDDSTYIEADTATEKARFSMADITDTTTTIHAVAIKARVRKTKFAAKTMRGYCRSNGTETNGTTIGLTEAYKVRTLGLFDRDPDGSIAWLDAAVNAAEFGVEVIS